MDWMQLAKMYFTAQGGQNTSATGGATGSSGFNWSQLASMFMASQGGQNTSSGFAAGESGGIPVYNMHEPGYSNSMAQGGFSLCTMMGGSPDTCGVVGAYSGMITMDSVQAAGKNAGGTDPWTSGQIAGQINADGTMTPNPNSQIQKDQIGAGNPNGGFMSSINRIATIIVGVLLMGAALYLFGTSSISSALQGALSKAD